MELYVERGFEQTTVADIAERAGLTARTFFRHFADKREVLFAGSTFLQDSVVAALAAAPETATPMEALWAGLDAAAGHLGQRREHSQLRQTVIAANSELQERELIKMASLSAALTGGMRRRGIGDADARLTAEVGIAVLRVAFHQWVTEPHSDTLVGLMRATFERVGALTAGRALDDEVEQ